jgi:hypothetical protein
LAGFFVLSGERIFIEQELSTSRAAIVFDNYRKLTAWRSAESALTGARSVTQAAEAKLNGKTRREGFRADWHYTG